MGYTARDLDSFSPQGEIVTTLSPPSPFGRRLDPSKIALVRSSNSSYASVIPAVEYYAANYGITKVYTWDFGSTIAPYKPWTAGATAGQEVWTNFLSPWVSWCQANGVEGVILCPGTPELILLPSTADKTTEAQYILSSVMAMAGRLASLGQSSLYAAVGTIVSLTYETSPGVFSTSGLIERNVTNTLINARYALADMLPLVSFTPAPDFKIVFPQPTPGYAFNHKGFLPYGRFSLEPLSDINVPRLKALVDRSVRGAKTIAQAKSAPILFNIVTRTVGDSMTDATRFALAREYLKYLGFKNLPYSVNVSPHWYGVADTSFVNAFTPPAGAAFQISPNDGSATTRTPVPFNRVEAWAFCGPAIQNTDKSTVNWTGSVTPQEGCWGFDLTSNGSAMAYLLLEGDGAQGCGVLNAGRLEPTTAQRLFTNAFLFNLLSGLSLMEANFFAAPVGQLVDVLGDPLYTPFKAQGPTGLRLTTSGEPNERPKHYRDFIRRY